MQYLRKNKQFILTTNEKCYIILMQAKVKYKYTYMNKTMYWRTEHFVFDSIAFLM